MNAQLRREGASPRKAACASSIHQEAGEVAFDRWLRQELGRLYDNALSEPVPEQLARLLQEKEGPG